MKIAFLAGHSSIHTVKWVNEMEKRGHTIHLITMHPGKEILNANIQVHRLPFKPPLGYYLNTLHLRQLLRRIEPDLLHTHYASGYGTLARLSRFHPNLLSVWGSDIFIFPYASKTKRKIIQKNLRAADRIASTSHIMKSQIENLNKPQKEIAVTPFGVDCERFRPMGTSEHQNQIRIGTVKKMASQYGIATLIKAFAILKSKFQGNIKLILVGGGPEEEELKLLVKSLNLSEHVNFVGPIPHHTVPEYLNSFDIYIALSENESFGVAIIEASACGVPVIVSDVGGLPEVVEDGKTGYIVPRNNPEAAADKMLKLLNNEHLRKKMGEAGRQFVLNNYDWKKNADKMERLYTEIVLHKR
jgi:glycosyltransferase involved in cell wall biosynthesis